MDGKKLRNYLKINNLSTLEVSEKLNVSRQTVYQYFKSESLSTEIKHKLKDVLNIDVDKLSGDTIIQPDAKPLKDYSQEIQALRDKIKLLEEMIEDKNVIINLLKK